MEKRNAGRNAANTAEIMKRLSLAAAVAMLAVTIVWGAPFMLAFAEEGYQIATKLIFRILRGLCIILGAFFMVFGIVKVAIAHQNENGPDQNKALMQTGIGLVLVMLGTIVFTESGSVYTSIEGLIKDALN